MFARTKRLTLRPGWPEDAAAVADAVGYTEVATRLDHVPWPYSLADAEAWLAASRPPNQAELLVFAHGLGRPALVGAVALIPHEEGLALGYWYTPAAWGRGYATEAGRAAVDMARHALGARRLVSRHHVDNPGSGRVLAKLGFRPTGERVWTPSRAQGRAVESVVLVRDLA